MSTDLEDKQENTTTAGQPDPGQAYVDREFGNLTSPEHMSQEGVSSGDLRDREESAAADSGSDTPAGERSLFKNEDDGPSRFGSAKNKLKKLTSNPIFIGGSIFGGGSLIGIFILSIVLLGSLKIPHLMENITAYQFARVTSHMSRSMTRVTATKIVVDSADNSTYTRFKNKYYSNPSSKVAQKWSKLDKLRPNKLISNFDKDGTFKMNYAETAGFGRGELRSITLQNRQTVLLNKPNGFSKYLPGVKFANDVRFSSQVAPVLQTSLKAKDVGWVVRSSALKEARQRAGINLIAWKVGQFKGMSAENARLEQARINYRAVTGEVDPIPSRTAAINDATKSAREMQRERISNDASLNEMLKNSGADTKTAEVLDDALKPTAAITAVGFLNPAYAIGVPACIIYEGSLQDSGPTINAQSESLKKNFYFHGSMADQQKNGYNAEPLGIAAANEQLGDITNSQSERRAAGLTADTSDEMSVQASAAGSFSILNVILPESTVGFVEKFADQCPKITSFKTAAVVGIINLGVVAASFGTAAGAEAGAVAAMKAGSEVIVKKVAASIVKKEARKATREATGRAIKGKLPRMLGETGATVGLTLLAKYITLQKMNAIHNGIQTGEEQVDSVDAGGNLVMNDMSRGHFFGMPMAPPSVQKDALANQQWLNSQQSGRSLKSRYVALANPNSLVTKLAMNLQSLNSLTTILQRVASSISSTPKLFSTAISGRSFADVNVTNLNTYYGQVQWGFTPEEEALINNDESYSFLDNQAILDASGNETAIAKKYAVCFGYDADDQGTLTPSEKQVGDLLAEGLIQRDEEGNVLDREDILCSETNLSLKNRDFGDMVFRWRLAQSDSNTIDLLVDAQDPVEPNTEISPPAAGTAVSNPSDVFGSSAGMPCPNGTRDGGDQPGYRDGTPVTVKICFIGGGEGVNAKIAGNILKLINDSAAQGITLSVGSGFRTMEKQAELYRDNCGNGTRKCQPDTSRPGYSNHQMGLAIDFGYNGKTICYRPISMQRSANCKGNAGFDWMKANAANYGLKNLPSEAWHWSVDGS